VSDAWWLLGGAVGSALFAVWNWRYSVRYQMSWRRMIRPDDTRQAPKVTTFARYAGTIFTSCISLVCALRLLLGIARGDF
jgi:uncharacterized membrane protein